MEVQPRNPTADCPSEWFTRDVFVDPIARGRGDTSTGSTTTGPAVSESVHGGRVHGAASGKLEQVPCESPPGGVWDDLRSAGPRPRPGRDMAVQAPVPCARDAPTCASMVAVGPPRFACAHE